VIDAIVQGIEDKMGRTLFKNCRFLISQAHPEGIIEHGAVFVDGPIIKAVGASEELESTYAGDEAVDILDCTSKIVMPGLIDSHNHLGLFHVHLPYGLASKKVDTGIMKEATDNLWPAYLWLTEEIVYDLTLFGLMHQLKHGTTTNATAFPFPDAAFRAAEHSRMRMVIQPHMATSVRLQDNLDEQGYLAQTEEVIRDYHNALDGLVTIAVYPVSPLLCTRSLLIKGMKLAHKYDVQFATHIFEAPDEVKKANDVWTDKGGAIQYLLNIGLLTPRSLFFHANLNEREIDVFAEMGCAIVHNPECNAGEWNRNVAYLPYFLDAGVTVGLGTDGLPRDMFGQMMLVKYLHNVLPREKVCVEPWVPLELATIGSARALWLDRKVGKLEPGKRADIITINLKGNTCLYPVHKETLFRFLPSSSQGPHVTDVLVDGVFLRRDNEFTIFDEEAITARVDERLGQFLEWYEARKKSRSREGKPMTDFVDHTFAEV
jgi:cytosine/adenosine deaminase-related metal-dependent hydrolase